MAGCGHRLDSTVLSTVLLEVCVLITQKQAV